MVDHGMLDHCMVDHRAGGRHSWWLRVGRRTLRSLLWIGVPWLGATTLGMNPSTPADYVMNLWPSPVEPSLVAAKDGVRRLVVLQHGLWRSAASLAKLERALVAHGYEVLNTSYASTAGTIEEHAELLRSEIEARLAQQDPRPLALSLVGHSMGGLVIRWYLQQPAARRADRVVFLGTPQHGAILCDLRRDWWLFRVLMGDRAAPQLSPGSEFLKKLRLPTYPFGTIAGGYGDGQGRHSQIPGDDDGTVAVAETELPLSRDFVVLPIGHTRLGFHDQVIVRVLRFLKQGSFGLQR